MSELFDPIRDMNADWAQFVTEWNVIRTQWRDAVADDFQRRFVDAWKPVLESLSRSATACAQTAESAVRSTED